MCATVHRGCAALVLLSACLVTPSVRAGDDAFNLDIEEYAAGVREHGLDDDTRVLGWQIHDHVYFGRRRGEIDDFGFVFKFGDTQISLTEDGIGWRRSISIRR
jgi:hypothetical protein